METLKVSVFHGWSPWSFQMRATVSLEIPRCLARDLELHCVEPSSGSSFMTVAAELDTPSQRALDRRLSATIAGLQPIVFRPDDERFGSLYPIRPFISGTTNLTISREVLLEIGGFREYLGPGTPTRAAEDIDLCGRVMLAGNTAIYAPDALVWNHQRQSLQATLSQVFGYGVGLSSYYLDCLIDPTRRLRVLRGISFGIQSYRRAVLEERQAATPLAFTLAELAGLLSGPFVFARVRSRRSALPPLLPLTPPTTASL